MSDPVTNPEPPQSKAPRWMKITLVISLATNLLIVGVVAGAVLSKEGRPEARKGGAGANMITEALPKEEHRALRRDVRRTLRATPGLREALQSEIAALADLMRAPDYTAEAVEAQLMQIQSRMMGPLSVARGLLAERLAGFDEAERAAYAARLEELLEEKRK